MHGALNYERLYEYRFREVDQDSKQDVWKEIAAYVYERLGRPDKVLDPCAGRCEFLNAIECTERWSIDQVDNATFRGAGIQAVTSDVFDAEIPVGHFDGVFVSNFLEHLLSQEDVARFLDKMFTCMESGGRIAVVGPNFKYASKEYFDCADHTLALSHVAVAEHLYAAGFTVEDIAPRFLPFSFRGLLPPSPILTRYYLRMRPTWRLIGKQFLLVASKP